MAERRYSQNMYPIQQGGSPFAREYQSMYDPAMYDLQMQGFQFAQGRHDQVTSAMNEQLAKIGEMETYDPDAIGGALDTYKERLDKLAKDYNYNYSQAKTVLTREMAKEAANPLYQLNRHKVEQVKREQQLVDTFGPEAILRSGSVRNRVLTPDARPEDYVADVVKASDYMKVANILGNDLRATINNLGLTNHPTLAAFMQYGSIKELSDPQIRAFASNPAVIAAFKANAPTVAFDNRAGAEWTQSDQGIANYLYGNWAGKKTREVDMRYMNDPVWAAQQKALENKPVIPPGNVYARDANLVERNRSKIDDEFNLTPATTSEQLKNIFALSGMARGGGNSRGISQIANTITEQREDYKQNIIIPRLKEKYPILNNFLEAGLSIEQGTEILRQNALRYNASINTSIDLHSPDVTNQIKNSILRTNNDRLKGTFLNEGSDMSGEDFKKLLSDTKSTVVSSHIIPATGEVEITFINNGRTYSGSLNSEANFDRTTKLFLEHSAEFHKKLFDIGRTPSQPGENPHKINFFDREYEVANYFDPESGRIDIFMRPSGSTNIADWLPVENYTGAFGQELREYITTTNSLKFNIKDLDLNIWNR